MTEPSRSARGVLKPRRLAARGRQLAREHETVATLELRPKPPTERVHAAGRALREAYRELAEAALGREDLPPGAAWILDNFYLVRDQLREVLLGLNRAHYRRLPRLMDGPHAGAPRIYEVLSELVYALDHSVGESDLTTMIRAYQEISPLMLGELWAIPGSLRIVLIERLAALATAEVEAHRERIEAADWARRIASAGGDDSAQGVVEAGRMFAELDTLTEAFAVELAEHLRAKGASVRPVLEWIERRLEGQHLTIEDIVREETQRDVSLANAFKSLRWTASERWGPWVERVSVIERALRTDPHRTYAVMDFETRDLYRRRVETLARGSTLTEWEVADRVVATARQAAPPTSDDARPTSHVGYHLIGRGREAFEEALSARVGASERLRRWLRRNPTLSTFGAVGALTAGLLTLLFLIIGRLGASSGARLVVSALAVLPVLDFAIALTNRVFAYLLRPTLLPKLSRKRGIASTERTLVVVPTLIASPEKARAQAERLEMLAFANPDPNLRFALLTDFTDAPQPELPEDRPALLAAIEAIKALNTRHADSWGDRFFILHRERRWSETERCWMGWERKRGKLEELNSLLRSPDEETSFTTIEGDFFGVTAGDQIRYVITLDADTRMPPLAALDLVRTAAHPLNRAHYDPERRRVTRGYGIIQPRVAVEATRTPRTPFAAIMSGNVGLDPYTHAVSDLYQDLFGEGIYTGKGLYDVDAFERALGGVIPAGAVLSHDLLESTFVRAGLATDILLFDEFPSHYIPWARRLHRWVRGDWQILPWLRRRIPVTAGTRIRNPIRPIGRWQILDNVRRSLNAFGILAFLLAGWILLPQAAAWWTLVALGVVAFPVYVNLTTAVFARPPNVTWRSWLGRAAAELGQHIVQTGLILTLLAHQALHQLDAAVRATIRMSTRRRLLEWMTAHQVEGTTRASLPAYLHFMWPASALGVVSILAVGFLAPAATPFAVPFVALWIGSPWVAWRLAQRRERKVAELTPGERRWLGSIGRRTWALFEDLWGPEHGWLPPDNLQLDPHRGVAPRTSPSNIGFALVAAQAAHDFGWLTRDRFLELIERTLEAVEALDSFQGHLFNWYETHSGRRLWPPYVSTADSGNFAAALIVLAAGLDEIAASRGAGSPFRRGLVDTVRAAADLTPSLSEPAGALLDELRGPGCEEIDEEGLRRLEPLADRLAESGRFDRDEALPAAAARNAAAAAGLAAAPLLSIRARLDELRSDATLAPARAERLADTCRRLFDAMDFRFLYAPRRGLLTIGYNVETRRQDDGVYDLLASEARLASLVASARGDVPPEHWFRLGRPVIDVGRQTTLLSWGGTMFEYLMPLVFTPAFQPTLLADSYVGAVTWQRRYATGRGLPWGTSESQYAAVNAELDYRYRAFGVPGLGLRRGLADDDVVAPYATALALMVDPRPALDNLRRLEALGALGVYGFHEAVDFTAARMPTGEDHFVVRTYMAHHAGMTLGALANALLDDRIQDLFRRSHRMRSVELLLQERVPHRIASSVPHPLETDFAPRESAPVPEIVDHRVRGSGGAARGQFLSNGRLRSYFHEDGSGSLFLGEDALIRSYPTDPRFPLGVFLYVRDLDSGRFWSVAHEPVRSRPDRLELWFHLNKIELAHVEDWVESFLEVVVSPEDDVEVRRLTVTNYSDRPRRLEVTSYAEVVLDDPRADHVHPAFSKLFVRTERAARHEALLATRRSRDRHADPLWLIHTLACDGARMPDPTRFETDRMRFIGRGRGPGNPRAMDAGFELAGSSGNVLDPIVSLQKSFTIGPGEKVQMAFCVGGARDREGALRLADLYDNPVAAERAIGLATTSATLERQRLVLDGERIQAYQQLGSAVYSGHPTLRAAPEVLARSRGAQPQLWQYGISGDLPIVVARIEGMAELETASWVQEAFSYWRRKGLHVDLVLLNEHGPSYADELQHALERLAETSGGAGGAGRVYVLRSGQLTGADRTLLLSVARAVIDREVPELPLSGKLDPGPAASDDLRPARPAKRVAAPVEPDSRAEDLFLENGMGGFDLDAHEYVIRPAAGPGLPAPWINVIANPDFGFLVSEAGGGTTWSVNSRQRRLSPWSNDPVRDPQGEALYLRDQAGHYWSVVDPVDPSLEVRHGMGYSEFRSERAGLKQRLTVHADIDHPVKVIRLHLRNTRDEARELTSYFYLEWVLGVLRHETAPHVVTTVDAPGRLVLARNRYDRDFGERVAFVAADADAPNFAATCDRVSFLGPNLDPSVPRALIDDGSLDGRCGPGLDPCAALAVSVRLDPRGESTISFYVGDAVDEARARQVAEHARDAGTTGRSLERVHSFWNDVRGAIVVRTPAPDLDVLLNGWLLYQTLSCRLWGRTAFYQSGGAFGFRDQLQDAMALIYACPQMTREQIVLHARHQFAQGDVLHWWHPPAGRGVRTRITDDLLWLPFVVAFYVDTTGDWSVLDEQAPYIEARQLDEDEHEAYVEPRPSAQIGDVYDHCCRAIERSLDFGPHGLPLIGTGDWNDGMNRVGEGGRGESVWLGFFLVSVLNGFIPLVRSRDDGERADRYERTRRELEGALEEAGWDGEWYRRAYFDDGTPLGSAENDECRIDAIAQAWAVISGVASADRRAAALGSLERLLLDREGRLLRLLTPPFERSEPDPGYIQGYPPGVRENGGQYTHGALWAVQAFAREGRGDTAVSLLRMMAPPNHARSVAEIETFRNEPFVVTADVYSTAPHTGRGGWSWYTGSGGWMYRVALEAILGFHLEQGRIVRLSPCIASDWPEFEIEYSPPGSKTCYRFHITNPDGVQTGIVELQIDGRTTSATGRTVRIELEDDGRRHEVRVRMGDPALHPEVE